jgi:hypothetical protein
MSRLKNVTITSVSLQMFNTSMPSVNGVDMQPVLFLTPGEDVDESLWLVTDESSDSYNAAIIDSYIKKHILTRIP